MVEVCFFCSKSCILDNGRFPDHVVGSARDKNLCVGSGQDFNQLYGFVSDVVSRAR